MKNSMTLFLRYHSRRKFPSGKGQIGLGVNLKRRTERVGERITDDIISNCHQCGKPCDTHVNCKNDDCHLLFIQCHDCSEKMKGCCTPECLTVSKLPIEDQRKLRKGRKKTNEENLSVYKSRLRPNLSVVLKNKLP